MRELGVRITLRSPTLLASAPPASNQLETLPFVPGNSLRGAMARRALDQGLDPAGEEFRRLFLTGETRFGFAHAEGAEALPLSARSCKYDAGFAGEGGHGVVDLLLREKGAEGCPECGKPLDYFQGFWLPGETREVAVATRLLLRSAIDPRRGTASAGQLYSQRVLAEGQSFLATVEAPDDLAPRLAGLLEDRFPAVLGTGGSRGLGWAEVEPAPAPAAVPGTARERFERFSAAWGRPVLVVTLRSDGLFRDGYLRDVTAPSAGDMKSLEIDPADWRERPSKAFLDTRQVFGFDGFPVRLPRPPRTAVAAGSVFLFEAKGEREPRIPEGPGTGWIGEVQGEGYGRAVLWHPFHLGPEGDRP